MEPALIAAVAFVGGYLVARNNVRWWQQYAYDRGYQQALADVTEAEDEVMQAVREQASLN